MYWQIREVQKDVAGIQIAMNDAQVVHLLNSGQHLFHKGLGFPLRERCLFDGCQVFFQSCDGWCADR